MTPRESMTTPEAEADRSGPECGMQIILTKAPRTSPMAVLVSETGTEGAAGGAEVVAAEGAVPAGFIGAAAGGAVFAGPGTMTVWPRSSVVVARVPVAVAVVSTAAVRGLRKVEREAVLGIAPKDGISGRGLASRGALPANRLTNAAMIIAVPTARRLKTGMP